MCVLHDAKIKQGKKLLVPILWAIKENTIHRDKLSLQTLIRCLEESGKCRLSRSSPWPFNCNKRQFSIGTSVKILFILLWTAKMEWITRKQRSSNIAIVQWVWLILSRKFSSSPAGRKLRVWRQASRAGGGVFTEVNW